MADAAAILDEASIAFVDGHRAQSAAQEKGNDFATEVDLALELQLVAELFEITGIGVHGKEFGGALAIFEELTRVCSKLRMHRSTGIGMAYIGAGILGAAISFGGHIWDHAAGVALVREAGAVVTDLTGAPWTVT